MEETRIVEINGVKMEVDLRHAKVVEQYKIGSPVKVISQQYENDYKVSPGVIVDMTEDGEGSGVIQILVLDESYSSVDIKIVTFGSKTKNVTIAPFAKYEMKWSDADINDKFDQMIRKHEEEIRILKSKKTAFNEMLIGVINA